MRHEEIDVVGQRGAVYTGCVVNEHQVYLPYKNAYFWHRRAIGLDLSGIRDATTDEPIESGVYVITDLSWNAAHGVALCHVVEVAR